MRVFIPATLDQLEPLVDGTPMPVRMGTAFALTPSLREAYAVGDDEELEHVAFLEASRASLRLLSDGARPRRVVLSADVPDAECTVRPDLDEAVVRIPGLLAPEWLAALHIDLSTAEPVVARAVDLIDKADLGDEDAELAVGDAEDLDLAWYDPSELSVLWELL